MIPADTIENLRFALTWGSFFPCTLNTPNNNNRRQMLSLKSIVRALQEIKAIEMLLLRDRFKSAFILGKAHSL